MLPLRLSSVTVKTLAYAGVFSAFMFAGKAPGVQLLPELPVAMASDSLTTANTALINGKFKQVEKLVGVIIAKGQQKPDVMARALLLRGIAYRNQRKYAKSIADFSNAEWLQKLRGVELRRLYAERALAYEAVGQKTLANKDRQLAGASSLRTAQRQEKGDGVTFNKKGVRKTSVTGKNSTSGEFFDGLGNLFNWNSAPKPEKKVVVKQVGTNKVAVGETGPIREIPTLDSPEAKANRAKLEGKAPAEPKVAALAKKTGSEKEGTPSNSAWAAQRMAADKKAEERAKLERQKTAKLATSKEVFEWSQKTQKTPTSTKPKKQKTPARGPIVLNKDVKKTQQPEGAVTSFFKNMFGGGQPEKEAPVQPAEEVISEDQVASIETTKLKPAVRSKVNAKPAKKPVKKKVAARPIAKPQARSLYHIQLGAFGEARAADKFVSRLNGKYKRFIGNKTAMVVETDLGNSRRQYRVYLGPFRSREKSEKSCRVLKKLGMGCALVK